MRNLSNTGRKRRRIPRAENACHFPDMEDLLASWIREKRESSLAVHVKAIRTEANKIFRDLYGEDQRPFSASTGWLSRFLRRHKLVSRRVTSVGQLMPSNVPTSAKTFIKDVSNAISTGNMDERPFWFDMPSNETYDFEGVKTVKSKTTGYEKLHFTVVLTALASGTKLKPMLIFKGLKNVPRGDFPRDCFVAVSKGGSMTTDLMKLWIRNVCPTVWQSRPVSIFRTPAVLVMDRHRSHSHEPTVDDLKTRHNTSTELIPGGMTCVLQPCDVSWNRSMKSNVRQQWDEWLEKGQG